MIELVSSDRCIECGLCAKICPTNVFGPEPIPTIARKEDCQTCFACEVYCPADALYVSPFTHPVQVNENDLINQGQLGAYRKKLGWKQLGKNIQIRMIKIALINNSGKLSTLKNFLSNLNEQQIKKLRKLMNLD